MILLLLLAGAGYVTYKVFLAPSAPPGSAFRDRMAALSDLDQIFNTPSETERFADPIYTCFGSNIVPSAMSRGFIREDGIWKDTVSAAEGLAGGAGVKPYEIVPNIWGIGGKRYVDAFGWLVSWPTPGILPCIATTPLGSDNVRFGVGYEYLSDVPNTAKARVEAMQAHVDAFAASRGPSLFASKAPSTPLETFAQLSYQRIGEISHSITNTLKDVTNYPKLAQAAGVSEEEIEERAKYVLDQGVKGVARSELVSKAAAVISPVATALSSTIQSALANQPAEITLLEGIAAAANWIPIYGGIIAGAAKLLQGILAADAAAEDAAAAQACNDYRRSIAAATDAAVKNNLPFPWHGPEVFDGLTCNKAVGGTPDQITLEALLRKNVEFMTPGTGLNDPDVSHAQRWWMTATTFMSDQRVFDIFDALGADVAGGSIASDEQVMLVAAPIAVSNGLEIGDFAKRLWARSVGWQKADEASFVRLAYEPDVCNGPVVRNAWWLQWAVLAKDAFELVDELKGRAPPKSVLGDPRTLKKLDIGRVADTGLGDKIGPIVTTPKAPKKLALKYIAGSGLK